MATRIPPRPAPRRAVELGHDRARNAGTLAEDVDLVEGVLAGGCVASWPIISDITIPPAHAGTQLLKDAEEKVGAGIIQAAGTTPRRKILFSRSSSRRRWMVRLPARALGFEPVPVGSRVRGDERLRGFCLRSSLGEMRECNSPQGEARGERQWLWHARCPTGDVRTRRRGHRSDQLQPLEAGMAVLADDDVVVDGDAERLGDLDDLPWSSGCRRATASGRRRGGCGRG